MTAVVGISPNRALLVNQRIHGVGIQRGNHYILLYHRSPQYVLRIDSLEVRKNRVPLKLLEIVSLLQLIALRLRIDFKERPEVLQIVKRRLKLAVSKLLETYHKGSVGTQLHLHWWRIWKRLLEFMNASFMKLLCIPLFFISTCV